MANVLSLEVIREQRLAAEQEIRKAEIRIEQARRHLADLEAAERVMHRTQSGPAGASSVTKALDRFENPMVSGDFSTRNPFRHKTNKAYIWEVLDRSPHPWLNANQIQEQASLMKGEVIPMVSISPMLSEMKGSFLARDNLLVALKARLKENGEAAASPDTDDVSASSIQHPRPSDATGRED